MRGGHALPPGGSGRQCARPLFHYFTKKMWQATAHFFRTYSGKYNRTVDDHGKNLLWMRILIKEIHPHQKEQETLKSKDIEIVARELRIRRCNDNFKSYKQQSQIEGSTCLYAKWSQISLTIGCSFFRIYPGKKTLMLLQALHELLFIWNVHGKEEKNRRWARS